MPLRARWRAWASHHRVHVGILFALLYVAVSRPAPERLLLGAVLVACGEAVRVWACGYLVRNEVLTRDGPYALVRHPLYLGSLLIGLGFATLAQYAVIWLAAFLALYLAFYLPAMYVEELRLQSLFGAEYQEYMEDVPRLLVRPGRRDGWPRERRSVEPFSWNRATRNREMRTVAVMAALIVVQVLKLLGGAPAAG